MKRFAVFTLIILVTLLAVGCGPKTKPSSGTVPSENSAVGTDTSGSSKDNVYQNGQTPSDSATPESKAPESPKDAVVTDGNASSGSGASGTKAPEKPKDNTAPSEPTPRAEVSPTPKTPGAPQGITVNKIKFTEIALENASEEVKQFVEQNKAGRGYHHFMGKDGEITLVLLSGEKNSGGYGIKVQFIEDNEGRAVVVVKETAPAKDAMVTMQITYPVTIVKFKGTTTNFNISNTEGMEFKPVKPLNSGLQPPEVSEKKIAVRGKITSITPSTDGEGFRMFVEGQLEADTSLDKAIVRVQPDTKVFKGSESLSAKDLKEGMIVEVEYDGPILKSYPAQIGADRINIL